MPRPRSRAAAKAAWQDRNARARALGYRNYYDYRVHRYGTVAPGQPAATGEEKRRLRGHAGAADLEATLATGRVAILLPVTAERDDDTGQWREVMFVATMDDGSQRQFVLRGSSLKGNKLPRLRDRIDRAGIGFIDNPSLDVFSGGR